MYSLFLDTTSGLTIGLLDSQYLWLAYEMTDEKRPSEVIHEKIFTMLSLFNLQIEQVQVFTIAGPGSYTGMRLSEGFAQILNWHGLKIYSFYHFDVPLLTGILAGQWITNAFKNQIFSFQWNGENNSTELLSNCEDLAAITMEQTKELIHLCPHEIFSKVVLLNHKKETYYFRTLEEEFG
jgi:tRNA threonylcarbamoyladenosine biosynthesis protein TsaB